MTECRLCGRQEVLRDSHVIPAFAVRWIKETSATSYIRGVEIPNLRKQDIDTIKLLCQDCETRFSRAEGAFTENIFTPYVSKELDERGCARGYIKEFNYGEWLLKFALSLQWRVLAARLYRVEDEAALVDIEKTWRQFLLDQCNDSGATETHMLFLSSLADAVIPDGLKLGQRVNMYLLHSVDATTVASDSGRYLGVYSKIGPIAFYTPVKPPALEGNPESKLHMRGRIRVAQELKNMRLKQFILETRPNEVHREISERQLKKMTQDTLSNPERALNSMSFHLLNTDFELERRKGALPSASAARGT